MRADILVAQLVSLRAQVEALLLMVQVPATDGPEPVSCAHPEERRTPANNLGEPAAFLCGACGQIVREA